MTTQAEEVPFLSAMEHESPQSHEETVSVGRGLWKADGMVHRILETLGLVQDKALSLAERGPDPDYAEASYARGVRDGARNASPRNFGGVNGNGWATWVLGIVGVLIAASVLGLTSAMFTMSQKVASLEAKVDIILATRK